MSDPDRIPLSKLPPAADVGSGDFFYAIVDGQSVKVPRDVALAHAPGGGGGGTGEPSDGSKGDVTVSGSGLVWDINPGKVGTAELADGAVQTAKLADTAVTTAKILNDAVDFTKIVNMPDGTLMGRPLGAGTGDPSALTSAQAGAVLGITAGNYLKVNYGGSRDPATDDTTNFLAQISATPIDKDGVKRIHLGPGWLNISGMTLPITIGPGSIDALGNITTRYIEFHLWGTQLVAGTFQNAGSASHPINARTLFRTNKYAHLSVFFHSGAAVHGCKYIVDDTSNPSIYSSAADWGARVTGIRIVDCAMIACTGGIVQISFDGVAQTEASNRHHLSKSTSYVVGDGVTTNVIQTDSAPLNSSGQTKLQPGDLIAVAATNSETGGSRVWWATVASFGLTGGVGPTYDITTVEPVPVGTEIGYWTDTLSGAHSSTTGNILTVTGPTKAKKGNLINITYDDATILTTWVYQVIDSTHIMLTSPLTKAAAGGNLVNNTNPSSFNSTDINKAYPPAVTYGRVDISIGEKGVTILPTSQTPQMAFRCGVGAHTCIIEHTDIWGSSPHSFISGSRQFMIAADSISMLTEYYMKSFTVRDLILKDYMTFTSTSGAEVYVLGQQECLLENIRFEDETRTSVNETTLTLVGAHVKGQHWVEVAEDTAAVVRKGYSVNSTTGEPNTSSLSAINLNTSTTTTFNATGNISDTTVTVASGTNFANNDIIGWLANDGTQRYNAIVSGGGTTSWTLNEALDKTVNSGVVITRYRSNRSPVFNRNDLTNTNLIVLPVSSPTHTLGGTYFWGRVNAVDRTRGIGHHRIYTPDALTGSAPAGTKFRWGDNNLMGGGPGGGDNGCERVYAKTQLTTKGLVFRNSQNMFQALCVNKSHNEGHDYAYESVNNSGHPSIHKDLLVTTDNLQPSDQTPDSQSVFYCQGGDMTYDNCWEEKNAKGNFLSTHNGTQSYRITLRNSGRRRYRGYGGFVFFNQCGGHNLRVENCENEYAEEYATASFVDGITLIHQTGQTAETDAPRTDARDNFFVDFRYNTWKVMNEDAASGTGFDRTSAINIQSNWDTISTPLCIDGIFVDGYMGRSHFCSVYEVQDTGRIKKQRFGARLDISDFTGNGNPAGLIRLSCNSAGTKTVGTLSTVTTASQTAGDRQITLPPSVGWNIPRGSAIRITLNSGTHTTWVTEDTIGNATGIIVKINDPIPSGKTVANGAVVTFRPVSSIVLDNPAAIGYAAERRIYGDGVATTVTLPLPGLFTKYLHSAGAPDPENVFIRSIAGDVIGVNIFVGIPTITPNDNTQAGGSIVWPIYQSDGTTPLAPSATTIFICGFSQPELRFEY